MTTYHYHTQVRILIDKHDPIPENYWLNNQSVLDGWTRRRLDVSGDAKAYTYNKDIQSIGTFSFTLAPAKPYLSLISVNDVVNIYVNIGELPTGEVEYPSNQGWIRRAFGYISSVQEATTTDPTSGKTTSEYVVQGATFEKAIDKTNIYFNPAMEFNDRTDFGNNLGGIALMGLGVPMHGMPRHLLAGLLNAVIGFGGQWLLPPEYKDSVLGTEIGGNDLLRLSRELREVVRQEQSQYFSDGENEFGGPDKFHVVNRGSELTGLNSNEWRGRGFPPTLADIISFDYLDITEGYIHTSEVLNLQGSLLANLINFSNRPILECFFDLRLVRHPVTNPEMQGKEGAAKNLSPTVDGLGQTVPANNIYVPCMVLRQYPFSYADSTTIFDMKRSTVTMLGGGKASIDESRYVDLGGDIWNSGSRAFNRPGATIGIVTESGGVPGAGTGAFVSVPYTKLGSSSVLATDFVGPAPHNIFAHSVESAPYPIFERVEITGEDIKDHSIAKSDDDVVNLFGIQATVSIVAQHQKFLYANIVPIPAEILIYRHGLREMILPSNHLALGPQQLDDRAGVIENWVLKWSVLLDHWYQHNAEYLKGTLQLRGMPAIRVGYRLDWVDRGLRFYVEGVTDQWVYQQPLQTTVRVSRGQSYQSGAVSDGLLPTDPKLVYHPPVIGERNPSRVGIGKAMSISQSSASRDSMKYRGKKS